MKYSLIGPWSSGLALFASVVLVFGCVPAPTAPDEAGATLVPGGVYTVCEGLWQQNNASLSYRDPNGTVLRDAYRAVNGGQTFGDTPTDAIVIGDTLIVCMSTSRELVMIARPTGEVLRRVALGKDEQPYRLTRSGDKLYASCLNSDAIIEFHARTLERTSQPVIVGPAPEGICATPTKLYVAISGLGDLRSNEPHAGTVQVLRRSDLSVVTEIGSLPNVGSVIADGNHNLVWVTYRHFASQPDSLGGIVAIDSRSDTIVLRRRLTSPTRMAIDEVTGIVYVLHQDGVESIALDGTQRRVLRHASTNGNDIWYSLWLHPDTGRLYVGNARTYVTDGEVLVYRVDGTLEERYPVGLNPTVFAY